MFGNVRQLSFNKMTIFINIAPIENFGPLQTLFLFLKIAIFCRIVPRWNSWKFRHSKCFVPLQTLFPSLKIAIFCRIAPRSKSENPHASFSMCCARFFCYVSKRLDFFKLHIVEHISESESENPLTLATFTSIKEPFSTRSPPGILCVDKIPISAPRVSLCR